MLPAIDCKLDQARAYTEDDRLVVTTGRLRRVWQWGDAGFCTREVVEIASGCLWADPDGGCDWQLPDAAEPGEARLVALSAAVQDDEGFTSPHVAVVAEIVYPSAALVLQYTIWAYPDAPGLRTQLAARLTDAIEKPAGPAIQGGQPAARVDRVPVGAAPERRRFFGYYNETQQRNDTHQDILKEEVIAHRLDGTEWCDWASVACIEDDRGGIALVKESHKCVNQSGHAGGGFVCDEQAGLACTGWGLLPRELNRDAVTWGWAAWCIAWSGGDSEREIAFKTYDRKRYPIDPARDIYVQANTWGSTTTCSDARRAACEESVLQELEACADIGIDVLQIDDGWQVPPGHHTWQPEGNGWHPHPESYPNGWDTVRERAKELGVRLGLWAAAEPVSSEELVKNFTDGGFLQFKLDFAHLRSREEIDTLMDKVRRFIRSTGHRVRVNWDVTENSPRYGYFFAREYGCIYLENRKPERPLSTVYRPHTVLRDLWQVARYLNLHRFQCSIQNVDRVDHDYSDAHLHSHSYATAIALMGIPLFFQQTQFYSDAAKTEIRELLNIYKQHRDAIYCGLVHPIGCRPDNASWTGFQCHVAEAKCGYLTLFRERCNGSPEQSMTLGWMERGPLAVTDLVTGEASVRPVSPDGSVDFRIDSAPGFLFLRYEV